MGNGNQRRQLEDLASGESAISIIDPVDTQDFPNVLAAADVLLLNELPGVAEMCAVKADFVFCRQAPG